MSSPYSAPHSDLWREILLVACPFEWDDDTPMTDRPSYISPPVGDGTFHWDFEHLGHWWFFIVALPLYSFDSHGESRALWDGHRWLWRERLGYSYSIPMDPCPLSEKVQKTLQSIVNDTPNTSEEGTWIPRAYMFPTVFNGEPFGASNRVFQPSRKRHCCLKNHASRDGNSLFAVIHCMMSGWWFGTFFIFPYIGNDHPNWLIFFRGDETTNQVALTHKWR